MTKQSAALCTVVSLFACSPPPEPAAQPAVSAVPAPAPTPAPAPAPAASSAEPAKAPPPAAPEPEAVLPEHVEKAVCVLESKTWKKSQGSTALGLRPDGPAFAHVEPATATAELGASAAEPAVLVHMSIDGVALRGWTTARGVSLFSARALTFNGVATPYADVALEVRSAGDDLELGLVPPKDLHFANPLSRHTRCDEVTLDPGRFDAHKQLVGKKKPRIAELTAGELGFSEEPGGPPAVSLDATGGEPVEVLETKGDVSRVVYESYPVVLRGWVPKARLTSKHSGQGFGTGHGVAGGLGADYITRDNRICKHPVALHARVGEERAVVGEVLAGTTLRIFGRNGQEWRITLPARWFLDAKDAYVFVDPKDLGDCEAQ